MFHSFYGLHSNPFDKQQFSENDCFRSIQEQIYYLYKEKRQPLLLAIDEAQYLNTGILNDIKMLMNYGYDSLNCFTLILFGESYLQDTLRKPVHEALNQRITVRYNYEGLSDSEFPEYIKHKLKCAGATSSIINDSALSAVHGYVQGNPRIIDNLMTDALNIGTQLQKRVIDEEAVITARGTRFHVITGSYKYGNYLCVPNMDFGCELSFLSDTFGNAEKISQHLDNPFDVESLVAGIKTLGSLDETT